MITSRYSTRAAGVDLFPLKYFIFIIAFILIFSFNYHFLWIMYDIIALILAAYYAYYSDKVRLESHQRLLIVLTLCYFVSISINSGHTFIGLLSTWDTFKHILIFLLLARIYEHVDLPRGKKFVLRLYHFIFIAILMQIVFVFYQVRTGVFFDNVAGSFGDGATHSMAYLSLLFVILAIILKKNILSVIFFILVGIWLNMSAENVGFFVLLPMLLLGVALNRKVKMKYIFIAVCVTPFIIALLGHVVYGNTPYRDVIVSRVSGFILHDHVSSGGAGRGNALVTAINRGGWFGNGPGSFSNIYLMNGYDYDPTDDPTQINIAESSHLIFESGVIGLVLTLMTYFSLLWSFFSRRRNKLFAIVFLTACMFYGSLLMTETQIFLLLIIMFAFKQFEHDQICNSIGKSYLRKTIYSQGNPSKSPCVVHKISNDW